MELNFPSTPFKTHGGAAVPHRKNTAQKQSVSMPAPSQVVIPMSMHVGAPCAPLVKTGDLVTVGQKIAESPAFVSAPIHATVSGKVSGIKKVMLPGGNYTDAIIIDSDGEMTVSPDVKPPVVNSLQDFLSAIKESGLVGLGGAGFPAHVKLNVPKDKKVDTLIINCAECEPYLTPDNREAVENTASVVEGAGIVKKWLGLQRCIIAIENNKPDAIAAIKKELEDKEKSQNDTIRVLPLRATYPQGAEKVLIKACTDREVGMGKLPADAGCIVMNITSCAFVADYMRTGMPLIKKRLTIDGSAIKEPMNVVVPIGTKISDVVAFVGTKAEPRKILMGGPMMGMAVPSMEVPVLKQNNGLLCFDEKDAHMLEPTACIRCGRCVMGCPMNLMPARLETFSKVKDVDQLIEFDVMNCMECGTCAFNCPAHRPLVQAIRLGKGLVRAKQAADKAKAQKAKEAEGNK